MRRKVRNRLPGMGSQAVKEWNAKVRAPKTIDPSIVTSPCISAGVGAVIPNTDPEALAARRRREAECPESTPQTKSDYEIAEEQRKARAAQPHVWGQANVYTVKQSVKQPVKQPVQPVPAAVASQPAIIQSPQPQPAVEIDMSHFITLQKQELFREGVSLEDIALLERRIREEGSMGVEGVFRIHWDALRKERELAAHYDAQAAEETERYRQKVLAVASLSEQREIARRLQQNGQSILTVDPEELSYQLDEIRKGR